MAWSEIYRDRDYLAIKSTPSPDPYAVVCFHYLEDSPSLDGEIFGQRYFHKRGINYIGIRSAQNDWFQKKNFSDLLNVVLRHTEGMTRVGYGASMGGYAAINFSAHLSFSSAIASNPQFSVDRRKVPFESQWADEARRITFNHDVIDEISPLTAGYILFDPFTTDGMHAEKILTRHKLVTVATPFAGHHSIGYLVELEMGSVISDMFAWRFDKRGFQRRLRVRRRESYLYFYHLSMHLHRKGRIAPALSCAERSVQIVDSMLARWVGPWPALFDPVLHLAELLDLVGRGSDSRDLIERFVRSQSMFAQILQGR